MPPQHIQTQPYATTPPLDVSSALQQILQGQATLTNELNNRFNQLNTRLKHVESVQASCSVTPSGQLPGKAVQNPREQHVDHHINTVTVINNEVTPTVGEQVVIPADSNVQVGGSHLLPITTEHANPPPEGNMTNAIPTVQNDLDEDLPPLHSLKIATSSEVHSDTNEDDLAQQEEHEPSENMSPRFLEAREKFLKRMLSLPKLMKYEDPGAPHISCTIGKFTLAGCICDTGASMSVMSSEIATLLNIQKFITKGARYKVVDQSSRECCGLLENIPVVVDNMIIPTDFAVVDMVCQPSYPLLFGRSFLASTNALIDVASGTVELQFSKHRSPIYTMDGQIINGCSSIGSTSSGSLEPLSDTESETSDPPPPDDVLGVTQNTDYGDIAPPYGEKREDPPPHLLNTAPNIDTGPCQEHHQRPSMNTTVHLEEPPDEPSPPLRVTKHQVNMLSFNDQPHPCMLPTSRPGIFKLPQPILTKYHDPGALTITCKIRGVTFPKSLCDTGASTSVMPLHIAHFLGFNNFKADGAIIRLADQTTTPSYGMLENVPVEINDVLVPTDFEIIKMRKEPENVLIFGRPFLASTGAVIDLTHGTVMLHLGGFRRPLFTMSGVMINTFPYEDTPPGSPPLPSEEEKRTIYPLDTPPS